MVRNRLGGQVRGFRLIARPEGLVLQGSTRTYYAKQLVQQTVMEASKLPITANSVEVVEA